MQNNRTPTQAELKAAKERAARERAREKARTPEAKAKQKAYREKLKAAKAKAEEEFRSPAAQAVRKAEFRDRFIRDTTRWQLIPVSKLSEQHFRYLLDGALIWSYQDPLSEQFAYVFPTALGWETSHHSTCKWDKRGIVFDGVIHDTAEQAKGSIFDAIYGPVPVVATELPYPLDLSITRP